MTAPMPVPMVSQIGFTRASPSLRASGLLGWVTCCISGLRLDGITVRQKRDGALALAYPARRDSRGGEHPYVLPIDQQVRAAVERQILAAVSRLEVAA